MEIEYFYKYRAINQYFRDSLENHYLRFSYPSDFNDPFDNQIEIYREENNSKIFEYPPDNRALAICSLSLIKDNILMWAHYADAFKGVCLEFKAEKRLDSGVYFGIQFEMSSFKLKPGEKTPYDDGFLLPISVEYKDEMPDAINVNAISRDYFVPFLRRKHSDWEYEEESRLIVATDNIHSQKLKFEKSFLNGIIFGLNTSTKNKRKIVRIIKQNYDFEHFHFYDSIHVEHKYAIDIVEISDIERYLADLK